MDKNTFLFSEKGILKDFFFKKQKKNIREAIFFVSLLTNHSLINCKII